jgi:hypothetical protein
MCVVLLTAIAIAQAPAEATGPAALARALTAGPAGVAKRLPEGIERIAAPRDAALAAWLDLSQNVPRHRHAYCWYVWDNIGTRESAAAIDYTVNAVLSQSSTMVRGVRASRFKVQGSKSKNLVPGTLNLEPVLLRYDLEEVCPDDFDRLWRELQKLSEVEPYFHQPSVIKGNIAGYTTVHVPVPRYRASDGNWYDYKSEKRPIIRRVEFGLHAGAAGPLSLLSEAAGGNLLPIVRADWFIATAWNSVAIDGIVGRYYQLAGIGRTQNEFLEQVGADPKLVAKLRADQRAVMISRVTGKWRQVEAFYGVVRPEVGPNLITITHDIKDSERGAKRHALLNLLNFEDQARELIGAKPNGLHLYLLTDGQGNRQDEAPGDVAAWPNSPHKTKRLTAGISCLECHGGNRGLNPVENRVRKLIRRGFLPVADLSVDGKRLSYAQVLNLLKGKYDGDLDGPLKDAGNALAKATDKATGGVFGHRSVEGAMAEIVRINAAYYERVTPRKLLRELGYVVQGTRFKVQGSKTLNLEPSTLNQEDELAASALEKLVPAVFDEDGRIGNLRVGFDVLRADVHEIYYEMALRDVMRE